MIWRESPTPSGVVIFSHGSNIPGDCYHYLAREWTRHGVACVFPEHHGLSENPVEFKNWALRARDLQLILGKLPLIRKKCRLKNIGLRNVGIAGHSLGAYGALQVAGMRVWRKSKIAAPLARRRPLPCLAMSPTGPGSFGVRVSSFTPLSGPLFVCTGTRDRGIIQDKSSSWRLSAFHKAPPGDKFSLVFRGADHFSFIDAEITGVKGTRRRARPPQRGLLRDVARSTSLFWRAYLMNDPESRTHLQKGSLPRSIRSKTVLRCR